MIKLREKGEKKTKIFKCLVDFKGNSTWVKEKDIEEKTNITGDELKSLLHELLIERAIVKKSNSDEWSAWESVQSG